MIVCLFVLSVFETQLKVSGLLLLCFRFVIVFTFSCFVERGFFFLLVCIACCLVFLFCVFIYCRDSLYVVLLILYFLLFFLAVYFCGGGVHLLLY